MWCSSTNDSELKKKTADCTNWLREWRRLFREKIRGANYTQLDWTETKAGVNDSFILFEDAECWRGKNILCNTMKCY